MVLQGEDELECAVGIGAVSGDIKAEDGLDIVGGEDTVVLRAESLVGLRSRDLGDVVRELELTGCKLARATFTGLQGALHQDFSWEGGGKASQSGDSSDSLHLDRVQQE